VIVARLDLSASFYGGRGFSLYHARGTAAVVPLSPHFHDEYLICAQMSGDEECLVAGKVHQFSAGDVVLINPQQVHTGGAAASDALEYISLYVDREVVRQLAHSVGAPTDTPEFTLVQTPNQQALIQELLMLLELVEQDTHAQLYPTEQAPDEADIQIPGRIVPGAEQPPVVTPAEGLSVESALQRVVVHAFEEFSNLRTPMIRSTNRVGHRRIARALDYIRSLEPGTNPAEVTLDRLAGIAGLSKFHFLRQFSQVVGITPGAYLRTLRLCHAARMLRTTDKPILDIALAVGFADHPSFSRAFARHMGMTPSEYQKLGPL
jgi:AraC-like DNA-binding protein